MFQSQPAERALTALNTEGWITRTEPIFSTFLLKEKSLLCLSLNQELQMEGSARGPAAGTP